MLDARAGREEQTPVFGQAPALGGGLRSPRIAAINRGRGVRTDGSADKYATWTIL